MGCLPQAQLPYWAGDILRVSKGDFRGLVERLAKKVPAAVLYSRVKELAGRLVVLGNGVPPSMSAGVEYTVEAEVPYCQEKYYGGRGVFTIYYSDYYILLRASCGLSSFPRVADLAAVVFPDIVATKPTYIYNLYYLLYRELGAGAKPLLELAKRAEKAGDKELAGVLRRLYAILEASGDIIKEIEQADYSRAAEEEVRKRVEEAVELFRETQRAASVGDIKRLGELLDTVLFESPEVVVTLGGIVHHLVGGGSPDIEDILHEDLPDPETALKEMDIYDVILTAAEHFGLEIMESEEEL